MNGIHRRWYAVVLLLFSGVVLADTRGVGVTIKVGTTAIRLYSESHALIIGASNYTNGWPSLHGVRDDVAAVRQALEAQGFDTRIVLDPTHDQLDRALRDFVASFGSGEHQDARLIIYFSGHGHTITTKDNRRLGYIVPIDAPNPNKDRAGFKLSAISMTDIDKMATEIESKHVLFVFDSCFAGSIFDATRAIPDEISEKTAWPVRQFITAGDADQQVPDVSIFRRQFVEGIAGEADLNRDGYVTGSELGMFLESKVTNYSHGAETPKSGKLMRVGLDRGDFVFQPAKRPAITTTVSAVPTTPDQSGMELALWNSIKDSNDASLFRDYLQRFPEGVFVTVAKARQRALELASSNVAVPAAISVATATPDLPEGLALAYKILEFVGGKVKVNAIQAMHSVGTMHVQTPQGPMDVGIDSIVKYPDYSRRVMTTPMGELTMVVTPDQAFMVALIGPQDMPGSQRDSIRNEARSDMINVIKNIDNPKFTFDVVGMERLGNIEAKVLAVNADGSVIKWLVDPATGKILRRIAASSHGEAVTDYSDWRTVEGISIPTAFTTSTDGKPSGNGRLTSFDINRPIDPKIFSKPSK